MVWGDGGNPTRQPPVPVTTFFGPSFATVIHVSKMWTKVIILAVVKSLHERRTLVMGREGYRLDLLLSHYRQI